MNEALFYEKNFKNKNLSFFTHQILLFCFSGPISHIFFLLLWKSLFPVMCSIQILFAFILLYSINFTQFLLIYSVDNSLSSFCIRKTNYQIIANAYFKLWTIKLWTKQKKYIRNGIHSDQNIVQTLYIVGTNQILDATEINPRCNAKIKCSCSNKISVHSNGAYQRNRDDSVAYQKLHW